jgi:hypothetical protein
VTNENSTQFLGVSREMSTFLGLIRLEFGFAREEHRLMSAILTPGAQQDKSKLLDQVRDVIRQAGKMEEADRLSRELRDIHIRITPAAGEPDAFQRAVEPLRTNYR